MLPSRDLADGNRARVAYWIVDDRKLERPCQKNADSKPVPKDFAWNLYSFSVTYSNIVFTP